MSTSAGWARRRSRTVRRPEQLQLPTNVLARRTSATARTRSTAGCASLPLGRFNPFLNAVTQLDGMQQAVGLVSPLYQALADQAFEESTSPAATGGSAVGRHRRTPTGRATTSGRSSTCSTRPRTTSPATRAAAQPHPRGRRREPGVPVPRGHEDRHPRVVKPLEAEPVQRRVAVAAGADDADPKAAAGVRKSRRQQDKLGTLGRLEKAVNPFSPAFTAAPAAIKREREREKAIRTRDARPPGTRKRRRRGGGARYGGGGRYGG
jgi:hypothetical protein